VELTVDRWSGVLDLKAAIGTFTRLLR